MSRSTLRPGGFGKRQQPDGVRGLLIRVSVDGKVAGTERRMTIGAYPTWTLPEARKEAKALRVRIDRGEDPLADKIEKRDAPTVAELCDRFLAWAETEKRSSSLAEDEALIRQWIKPELGSRKVVATEIEDIEDLHRKISVKTPIRANRVRSLLSKMFAMASTQWRAVYKLDHNPVKGSRRTREHGRRRYPRAAEMARLMASILSILKPAANRKQEGRYRG